MPDYHFYGLRLCSALPLPSLQPWHGADDAVSVKIEVGDVPDSLQSPCWSSSFVQIGHDRSALVTVAAVGRFWLPDGERVVYQPAVGVFDYELETFLLGTVSGLLLQQRRISSLHASCVLYQGRAVLLLGGPAVGKSALAAGLIQRGATLITDDICALSMTTSGVFATGAATRIRLWPDVMDHWMIEPENRFLVRANHPVRSVTVATSDPESWPVSTLIEIHPHEKSESFIQKQTDMHILFPPPSRTGFAENAVIKMGNTRQLFQCVAALADQVQSWQLKRTRLVRDLDSNVELILGAIHEECA